MNRKISHFVLAFILLPLFACHRGGTGDIHVGGDVYTTKPVVDSPIKVRVADVSNDTHKVYDVDIIGLLWNGIEESLKNKGMLWNEQQKGDPYVMVGHVLYFRKGGIAERFLPYVGDTIVQVKVELSRGGIPIATIESRRKVTFGKGTITREAWKKVFDQVSEDVVNQAVKKF